MTIIDQINNFDEQEILPGGIDLKMNIPKGHLFIVMLIIFMVGGFALGYIAGNYSVNEQWSSFFDSYKERVDRTCICMNYTTAALHNY